MKKVFADKSLLYSVSSFMSIALIASNIFLVAWAIHEQSYIYAAVFAFVLVSLISIRGILDHENVSEAIKKDKMKK